jgi:phospholipid/cholesterol/gamma-HCH transport system permease protein
MNDAVNAGRSLPLAIDHPEPGVLRLRMSGRWTLDAPPPSAADVFGQARAETDTRVRVEGDRRLQWDSGLLVFLHRVLAEAERREMVVDLAGLPEGARRLLVLARATPEDSGVGPDGRRLSMLGRIGTRAVVTARSAVDVVAFVGEAAIGGFHVVRGVARFRRSELFLVMQQVGAQALPIVSLITFLVGVILAYVGAVQLRAFGAQVYVADLVGVAMTREMGAMMTGIVMAGRTGAAFAAQLATMQANEEIDALTTFGISPMEFLVVPRMMALALMMPLLGLYADLLGVLGGTAVRRPRSDQLPAPRRPDPRPARQPRRDGRDGHPRAGEHLRDRHERGVPRRRGQDDHRRREPDHTPARVSRPEGPPLPDPGRDSGELAAWGSERIRPSSERSCSARCCSPWRVSSS